MAPHFIPSDIKSLCAPLSPLVYVFHGALITPYGHGPDPQTPKIMVCAYFRSETSGTPHTGLLRRRKGGKKKNKNKRTTTRKTKQKAVSVVEAVFATLGLQCPSRDLPDLVPTYLVLTYLANSSHLLSSYFTVAPNCSLGLAVFPL